jgi:predicted nucleic acid-binding protein
VSRLLDTSVLIDYLNGEPKARAVLEDGSPRAVSVVTWLEVMSLAPEAVAEQTRGFLRTFERLSVSEAVADEALRLMGVHPGLPYHRALTWACARVNKIPWVTSDARNLPKHAADIEVPYRWPAAS